MNSIIKLLLYKRDGSRLSVLKILSLLWFILWLIIFSSSSILAGIFGALMMTVPLFSIGLIIKILFIDDEEPVQSNSANTEPQLEEVNQIEATNAIEEKPAEEPIEEPIEETETTDENIKCPDCGFENDAQANFCKNCGTKLIQ